MLHERNGPYSLERFVRRGSHTAVPALDSDAPGGGIASPPETPPDASRARPRGWLRVHRVSSVTTGLRGRTRDSTCGSLKTSPITRGATTASKCSQWPCGDAGTTADCAAHRGEGRVAGPTICAE